MIIITGPNMAGKSTILRQAALIVLMAQMGSFVPAESAEIGLVDQIFTRVGASDDLSSGQSTFMVEMQETAQILHQATQRSLVLLDEIGRGTSTFDGLSIAWAVAEYLHDLKGQGVKTLFATHYHELTDLTQTKKKVKNYHVSVKEFNSRSSFSENCRRGEPAGATVSRWPGWPGCPLEVIQRAREVLENIWKKGSWISWECDLARSASIDRSRTGESRPDGDFSQKRKACQERLKTLAVEEITPLQALITLKELKDLLEGEPALKAQSIINPGMPGPLSGGDWSLFLRSETRPGPPLPSRRWKSAIFRPGRPTWLWKNPPSVSSAADWQPIRTSFRICTKSIPRPLGRTGHVHGRPGLF